MNPLIILLGLLGAMMARGGGSGGGSSSSSSESNPTPVTATPDDDPEDGTDGGMADHDGNHDHDDTDHGDMDGPSTSPSAFVDITTFGTHHGTSSHTHEESLEGGRTPITTEAQVVYNGLRDFLGLDAASLDEVGEWAFDEGLTNNEQPYGEDVPGVGLYYMMQGAKVGWIADDAFDPQILADIQLAAREDEIDEVMMMVDAYGLNGFGDHLEQEGLVDEFVNTLKMEPHYGGWMHGRVHGWLKFEDGTGSEVAIAHDLNHLTVLSHDQTQPFMNDTFDWPQWPALDVPQADVANYFQSMVTLGDPHGAGIEPGMAARAAADDFDAETAAMMASLAVETPQDSEPNQGEDDEELMAEAM